MFLIFFSYLLTIYLNEKQNFTLFISIYFFSLFFSVCIVSLFYTLYIRTRKQYTVTHTCASFFITKINYHLLDYRLNMKSMKRERNHDDNYIETKRKKKILIKVISKIYLMK